MYGVEKIGQGLSLRLDGDHGVVNAGKTGEGPLGCICYRRHLYESSPFCDVILRDPGVPSYGIFSRHMHLLVF